MVMAANNPLAIVFAPGPVPSDPQDLPRYLKEEFNKLQNVVQQLAATYVPTTNVAPPKPAQGMIRLADGVNWNPVAAGAPRFVGYRAGAWVLLG